MKIVWINGSPRIDGACSTVTNTLMQKFENEEHEIHRYHLNSLKIHGCQECFSCRRSKSDRCAVKDDLSEILEMAKSADLLILSTPVFYADISAQLKCFIDRTWSYYGRTGYSADHLPRNRSLVYIQAYGYTDPSKYDSLFEKYKIYFQMFGFEHCYQINAYGAQWNTPEILNEREIESTIEEIVPRIKSLYS